MLGTYFEYAYKFSAKFHKDLHWKLWKVVINRKYVMSTENI
jgi:hypothetical protein